MSAPVVKICGVRTVRHAQAAAEAGADMVGLVFAPSRRQVTPAEAKAITGAAYVRRPRFVGVFVNERPDTVEAVAQEIGLDLVQLSGDERSLECRALHVPYMKVVHVQDEMQAADVLHIANRYRRERCAEAIVLDAVGAGAHRWGGAGVAFDHTVAAEVVRRAGCPVLLAGGLRPDTVGDAIRQVRPWGVDVSSGVETDGVKDEDKITVFIAAAKGAASVDALIELQYTPWATAHAALRSTVIGSFERAGLVVAQETAAPGSDGPLPAGMTWARTGLDIRFIVTIGSESPGATERRIFVSIGERLGEACAEVRGALPELPLGLAVITAQSHRSYVFPLGDSSEDVRAGIEALTDNVDHERGTVFGWDRYIGRWMLI